MKWLALVAIAWLFAACGGDDYSAENKPAPPPADPAFAKIQPVIAKNCGPCHGKTVSPAFTSAAAFKGSKAKARLEAGTMPPAPKTITAEDKQALLAYLQ